MPLFEVEGDRHHMLPGAGAGTATTAHRVVDTHIDGLLGEQIFPVLPGQGPDEPHLLALDASGAPVVVELVSVLDDNALNRALDHAGAAGRMTRGQLASLYRGGPSAFHRDVAEFYDSVPVTRTHTGRAGARLIIICQDADEAVLNAIDFLRQPSMPVEVLRLGVVHAADGRKLVDVSPLVIHPASAPDQPRIVMPGESPAEIAPAGAAAQSTAELEEAAEVELALTGKLPVVVKAPEAVPVAEPVEATPLPAVRRRSRTDRFAPPSAPTPSVPAAFDAPAFNEPAFDRFATTPAPAREPFAPPSDPVPSVGLTDPTPHLEDLARIRRETLAGFAINPADDPLAWNPGDRWTSGVSDAPVPAPREPERTALAFGEVFAQVSSPLDPEWGGVVAAESAPPAAPEPEEWWRQPHEPVVSAPQSWEPPATGPIVLDEDTDDDLVSLARALGTRTLLVWERPRRGQRFDAVLHPDGRIELADGLHYRHPDVAAAAVSGSYTADGWSVWRVGGPKGPTLAEEFHRLFA